MYLVLVLRFFCEIGTSLKLSFFYLFTVLSLSLHIFRRILYISRIINSEVVQFNQVRQLYMKPTIFYVLELIGNFRSSGQHICLRFTLRSLIKKIVVEFTIKIPFNKNSYHKETTSQLICISNQLTHFYITIFY